MYSDRQLISLPRAFHFALSSSVMKSSNFIWPWQIWSPCCSNRDLKCSGSDEHNWTSRFLTFWIQVQLGTGFRLTLRSPFVNYKSPRWAWTKATWLTPSPTCCRQDHWDHLLPVCWRFPETVTSKSTVHICHQGSQLTKYLLSKTKNYINL